MQLLYHHTERTDKWNQSTARLQILRKPLSKGHSDPLCAIHNRAFLIASGRVCSHYPRERIPEREDCTNYDLSLALCFSSRLVTMAAALKRNESTER
jgi:hypothetical protein